MVRSTSGGSAVAELASRNDLAVKIENSLRETGYTLLRRVQVAMGDGCIELRGQVPSYYLKQVAQETVLATLNGSRKGVAIKNELEVITAR